jgi:hypothetical protein
MTENPLTDEELDALSAKAPTDLEDVEDGRELVPFIRRMVDEIRDLRAELVEGPLPVLLGWETAPFDEECHWCVNGIRQGGRVAVLSTAARVCESCAGGQRRGVR